MCCRLSEAASTFCRHLPIRDCSTTPPAVSSKSPGCTVHCHHITLQTGRTCTASCSLGLITLSADIWPVGSAQPHPHLPPLSKSSGYMNHTSTTVYHFCFSFINCHGHSHFFSHFFSCTHYQDSLSFSLLVFPIYITLSVFPEHILKSKRMHEWLLTTFTNNDQTS